MTAGKSFLLTIRDAAKAERDEVIRLNLRMLADELAAALAVLSDCPSRESMITVNGKWAQADALLNSPGRNKGGGNRGGAMKEGALLAKVA